MTDQCLKSIETERLYYGARQYEIASQSPEKVLLFLRTDYHNEDVKETGKEMSVMPQKSADLCIRIEPETKEQAEAVLSVPGVSASDARQYVYYADQIARSDSV